jgi:hypothetical protein
VGKTDESIFEGSVHTIPLADVQHYEKHWYQGDERSFGTYRGILVITKHTKWNFEHDTWENGIYLAREDADKFRLAFNRYRADIERETLTT